VEETQVGEELVEELGVESEVFEGKVCIQGTGIV